jgi:hypothetical protein
VFVRPFNFAVPDLQVFKEVHLELSVQGHVATQMAALADELQLHSYDSA